VPGLQLPVKYSLDSFFFLDRQHGWVVASEMKARDASTRLWRTQDGGKSWEELAHNLPPGGAGQFQFVTPTLGWLRGGGGLWRTEDGGTMWQQVSKPTDEATRITGILFLTPLEGWITGEGTLHQTTDGGQTWTLRYDLRQRGQPWLRRIQFPSPTEGWVRVDGMPLARTRDGGQTWQPVRVRHPRQGPLDEITSLHFLSPQVGVLTGQHHQSELLPKAKRERLSPVALGYWRPYILVTFDGGKSWSYHDLPIPVSQWSQAGPNLLYGINSVDATAANGIVEVRLTPPQAKPKMR
jgi:photosystem II stability/assembly factor-like uncharacterized protein